MKIPPIRHVGSFGFVLCIVAAGAKLTQPSRIHRIQENLRRNRKVTPQDKKFLFTSADAPSQQVREQAISTLVEAERDHAVPEGGLLNLIQSSELRARGTEAASLAETYFLVVSKKTASYGQAYLKAMAKLEPQLRDEAAFMRPEKAFIEKVAADKSSSNWPLAGSLFVRKSRLDSASFRWALSEIRAFGSTSPPSQKAYWAFVQNTFRFKNHP